MFWHATSVLLKHIRVSCRTARGYAISSTMGAAIVLKTLKHIFVRKTRRDDARDDEEDVEVKLPWKQFAMAGSATGLMILPFRVRPWKGSIDANPAVSVSHKLSVSSGSSLTSFSSSSSSSSFRLGFLRNIFFRDFNTIAPPIPEGLHILSNVSMAGQIMDHNPVFLFTFYIL